MKKRVDTVSQTELSSTQDQTRTEENGDSYE